MNTKFFILLLVALLITNTTSSILNNKLMDITPTIEVGNDTIAGNELKSTQPMPWLMDWETSHDVNHHPDDDGKFHHFHFHRLSAIKRRRLLCLYLNKLILAVVHLRCFIYVFTYLFH